MNRGNIGHVWARVVNISHTRWRILVTGLGVLLILGLSLGLLNRLVPGLSDPVWLREQFLAFGDFAPVIFILVQAGQVIFAPIPGQLLAFVGGYLFGVVSGTFYSLLGAALGSAVVFTLARRYGRPYVNRILSEETMTAFDGLVARDGRMGMFLVFLIPGLPDDVICVLGGLTTIPVWQLVGISILGRFPGYLAVSYAGAGFAAANYLETTVIVTGLSIAGILGYRFRHQILRHLGTNRQRVSG